MRAVSNGFIEASLSPVGFANAYMLVNNTTVDASNITEISIQEDLGDSGAFSIGTFNTREANITVLTKALPTIVAGVPISIYFGYYVSGSYEYVPMGTFYAQPKDISRQGYFTKINAHDKSWRMTQQYVTSLNWGSSHTAREVLNEVATQAGITLGSFGGLNPSNVTVYEAPKGAHRDVIAQMALLTGTNAKINRSGSIDFIRAYPSTPVEDYGAYNYRADGFSLSSDAAANFGKLTVVYTQMVGEEEQTTTYNYTAGSGSNTLVIESTNIQTQTQTNTLGQTILGTGLSYYGYTANLPGQPQIDLGDTISVENIYGEIHNLLVLQATHTFNGSMKSTFGAVVNDEDPEMDGNNISGSISEQVNQVNDAVSYAKGKADYAAEKADEAAAAAGRAEEAAQNAWDYADDANDAAQNAWNHADEAYTAAGNAASAASAAQTSANQAASAASAAQTSANNAQNSATDANKYANAALDQLGVFQDVIGVLEWASEHGSFVRTTDTTAQEGKVYFTYDSQSGDYVPVVDPASNPRTAGYYELSMDEAMQTFIMSHLTVTGRGLWVLPNGINSGTVTPAQGETQADAQARLGANYKMLLSNNGMYVYDGAGVLVATYGENISFNATRPQYIGNSSTYIAFNPNNGGSLTINGATINITTDKTLDEVLDEKLDSVDVSVTQTTTGANITVNGDTVSIANGERGGKILKTTTAPSSYTTQVGSFTPSYRIALATVKAQSGSSDVIVGDVIEYSYYHYPVGYVDANYVYTTARQSMRGATGTAGKWYAGTGITGTSTTATIFPNSGVSSAVVGDMYLNTDTGYTYRCTTAGAASAAKWVYTTDITGPQGGQGDQGVSVTSSTPYYKLATTTPAKPTNNTQPTGWSTTQPALDTTQNCYVVVQTVFSTGNITYSDVSTLSEYEASKQAYALADQADGKADANSRSINTLIERADGVDTIIREYVDGVLTARVGNPIGSLVDADGSFSIVKLTWNGNEPTVGDTIATFGSNGVTIYDSDKNAIAQYGNMAIIGDPAGYHIEMDGTEMGLYEGGSKVAYITNNSLYIPQTTATDEVRIGEKWTWKYDSNDESIFLKWIG